LEAWRDGRLVSFFFASRRRHTRCYRDWSSDVCSSDLRRADARRALHRGAEWLPRLVRPPGPEIEERRWIRRLALDENRVAAVGKLDRPRRALAILRGHARRPALWQDLQVTVAREQGRKRGCCHAGRSFASRRRECTIGPA